MEEKNSIRPNGNYPCVGTPYDPRAGVPHPENESLLETIQTEQGNLQLPDIQSIKAENARMLKKSVNSLRALQRANSNYLSQESRCLDLQISNLFSVISSEDNEETLTSEIQVLQNNLSNLCGQISEIEDMLENTQTTPRQVPCGCKLF